MRASSFLLGFMALALVACGSPRREEAHYVDGITGRDGIVFGQAFFDVKTVENLTMGGDPKIVYFVLPMQFSVQECGGVTVHAAATLDTFTDESAFQNLHEVREGVFREALGHYLVVSPSKFDLIGDAFDFTKVRVESADMPCATAWLEDRLHRVRVRSESEIRNRLP